jgi:hypothetical protein
MYLLFKITGRDMESGEIWLQRLIKFGTFSLYYRGGITRVGKIWIRQIFINSK